MLTIIGTGHVFRIAETVSFLVRQSYPDAVCIEYDDIRYYAAIGDKEMLKKSVEEKGFGTIGEYLASAPKIQKKTSDYQSKVSAQNNSSAGADMMAAIGAAKSVDAPVYRIDYDVVYAMGRMWEEMPGSERFRYRFSGILDNIFKKRRVKKTQTDYTKGQEAYVESMRKKYPTMIRVLIDERNEHMAKGIAKVCADHENVVVVVGDAHVDGLLKLLPSDQKIRTVRLWELMDSSRAMELKSEFWE